MSLAKWLLITTVLLATFFGVAYFVKNEGRPPVQQVISHTVETSSVEGLEEATEELHAVEERPVPEADRVAELFNTCLPQFPIVETIIYKSRVPWLKGRPAWLSDYASQYETSRHFIARSLNGGPDYFKQDIAEGKKFTVFKKDIPLSFHLLIDASRHKLFLFYKEGKEEVLIKTYTVGLGRSDPEKVSGSLTPLGTYLLGSKVAIYKPKTMGFFNGKKTEMIRVFGTRWIPFDQEIADCTAPAKGLGLHGVPWNEAGEELDSLGKNESDGCIRLSSADVEELFAIVITKPTTVQIVRDYFEVK